MTDPDIRDNVDSHRYELHLNGQTAVVTYNLSDRNLMITETLVPKALEGQGIASRLARHVIDDARSRDLLILPVCTFFAGYLKKHPEHTDVVHPTWRSILGLPK